MIKLGIFDLTGCGGCGLEILNLEERLLTLLNTVEIVNWRLVKDSDYEGHYDISLIEGAPTTQSDLDLIKTIRKNSLTVIALGACAHLGKIPAWITDENRPSILKKTYGKNYQSNSLTPKPLSEYIYVEHFIPGCPIDQNEVMQVIINVLAGKKSALPTFAVCQECKEKENLCLFLKGEPCLGPVTTGGCQAICPSHGIKCWGCRGLIKNSNLKALKLPLKKMGYNSTDIVAAFPLNTNSGEKEQK